MKASRTTWKSRWRSDEQAYPDRTSTWIDRFLIGLILLKRGELSEEELNAALRRQEETLQRLGRILMDADVVSLETLRKALEQQREAGLARKLTGIVLDGRGVLRPGYRVETAAGEGVTTSGTFSPTLQKAIALGRVPFDAAGDCAVDIRGKPFPARRRQPVVYRGRR